MLIDERLNVVTRVPVKLLKISSLSSVFRSTEWLERELTDFTGFNFCGLTDTRRLLLDYFEERQTYQTHVSNDKNYNNVFYDISLAF